LTFHEEEKVVEIEKGEEYNQIRMHDFVMKQ